MSLVPLVAVVMIFAIPIIGILFAGYKEWLEFKSKHQDLGISTHEIENQLQAVHDRVERLETERDALRERVQNLETIVTSEAWIAGHDEETDASSLKNDNASELSLPPDESAEENEAERTAKIARRLRGQ